MFLKRRTRTKDGKTHAYYSVCESLRVSRDRVVQRQVLHLGELNTTQLDSWQHSIDVLHEDGQRRQLRLFTDRDQPAPHDPDVVEVKLSSFAVKSPRRFGDGWAATQLWEDLGLHTFWRDALAADAGDVPWDKVLELLVVNRLLAPRSELFVHEKWFPQSAMDVLLDTDARIANKDRLYRCLDRLLVHQPALEQHLAAQWQDLFGATFDLLLYDLTSTYFEGDADAVPKARRGYSRDHRPDCKQLVLALIVTPEGFPLAYEVLPGNTADKTTLRDFLEKIEAQYGKARRIWVMDRGIPTEEVLAEMRAAQPPVQYLVGTPKGRLSEYEQKLTGLPWHEVREGVRVKLLPQGGEFYLLAESADRVNKERAMRRRQWKWLWKRLQELQAMELPRDSLLLKLGAARQQAPAAWRLIQLHLPPAGKPWSFQLRKNKLRQVRRREGRYLLRSNLSGQEPAQAWAFYLQLTQVEAAFKDLKDDLSLRPIHHQSEARIEAHIFVAFLAYCLHVSLRRRLRDLAPGLTSRAVLDKFASVLMLDVHLPTTDGRTVILTRSTQPSADVRLLLQRLKLELPAQPPPKITAPAAAGGAGGSL